MKQLLSIILCISMLLGIQKITYAEEVENNNRILITSSDLSGEQEQLIFNYLNIGVNERVISEENDGGDTIFECIYLELTLSGGVNVKTVNINSVTSGMIKNALITSGITNCNVICVSPFEVSGENTLSRVFKAYNSVSNTKIPDEMKELANIEVVLMQSLTEYIGQTESEKVIRELKELIICKNTDSSEISKVVRDYIDKNNLSIDEQYTQYIEALMKNISDKEYDKESVKNEYTDIEKQVNNVINSNKGFLDKVWDFIVGLWKKITGTYDEEKQNEINSTMKSMLGILGKTNEELLNDNIVVTSTVDNEVTVNIIKQNNINGNNSLTFEMFKQEVQDNNESERTDKTEEITGGYLDYVTSDFDKDADNDNNAEESTSGKSGSFDDLISK